eukprot:m.207051 g.207051  ORF g.207051 m.207051 type:complete len:598 (+) comp39689_c1_seq15:172-1965(+)
MSQPEFFVYGRATPRHPKDARRPEKAGSTISSKSSNSTPHAPRIHLKETSKRHPSHGVPGLTRGTVPNAQTKSRLAWSEDRELSQRIIKPFRKAQPHIAPDGIPRLALGKLADPHELEPVILNPSPAGKLKVSSSTLSWGSPEVSVRQYPVMNAPVPPLDLSFKDGEVKEADPVVNTMISPNQEVTRAVSVREAWGDSPNKEIPVNIEEEDRRQLEHRGFKKETIVSEAVDRSFARNPFGSELPAPPKSSPVLYVGGKRSHRISHGKTYNKLPSDHLMSDRVRFNARVVTSNGRDIHRQLCGFFFAQDGTLTIYEFRQLSSRSSALPLIRRGSYEHKKGPRRGKAMSLVDVRAGSVLTFSTADQPSLPESLKGNKSIGFYIRDADEEAKKKIMRCYHGNDEDDTDSQYWDDLEKAKGRIHSYVERQLRGRASVVFIGLVRYFMRLNLVSVSKAEFKTALVSFRVNINDDDFGNLWNLLDDESAGVVDYNDLMHSFLSEMEESGKSLVQKAFIRMDAQKAGTVSIESMKKFFNPRGYPEVSQGKKTEAEVFDQVFSLFAANRRKELSFQEFEAYYNGVFQEVNSDDDFSNLVKKTWNI